MSEYQAILAIRPALQYTIGQFWPLRLGPILRLLIISFFIGAWITSPFPMDMTFADIPYLSPVLIEDDVPSQTSMVTAVMIGILVLLLVYAIFSSIFQFIFVDYLSSKSDGILPSLKARAGMGIRLLGFYLATILLIGLCAAVVIVGIAVPVLVSNPDDPAIFFVSLLYALTGLLILIIPVWILTIMTTDFVVPVMIVHHCGIIQGWKIILKEFSGKWDETGIYLLFKIGINTLTGLVLGVLLVVVMESLGYSSLMVIPGFGSSGVSLQDIILPFILMAVVTLVVMTPVVTFLRYYALIFLELLSDTYALLPEVYTRSKNPGIK